MEKITRPDEILVRFQADGTAAMHVVKTEWNYDDDGNLIGAPKTLLPVPLPLAGPEFDALIPALDQALLANGAQLLAQVDALTAEKEALAAELTQLRSELERLQAT